MQKLNGSTTHSVGQSKPSPGNDKFGNALEHSRPLFREPNPDILLGRSDEEQLRAQQNLKNSKDWWHSQTYSDDGFKNFTTGAVKRHPILLDLDAESIFLTGLGRSPAFMDSKGAGLNNRTERVGAWNGDRVLLGQRGMNMAGHQQCYREALEVTIR